MNWLKQLFVRKQWTVIDEYGVYFRSTGPRTAIVYVMKDQFGNIKEKRISI
jgi:hypothetical protein